MTTGARENPSPTRKRGIRPEPRRRLVRTSNSGWACIALIGLVALIAAQVESPREQSNTRFVAVDVLIDSGNMPLAAYQFELSAAKGSIQIVGVEGGEHATFAPPPYYDPLALTKNRIVVAAFNTGTALPLPTGKARVARVHLQIVGDAVPESIVKLEVAADRDGRSIPATISATPATSERTMGD